MANIVTHPSYDSYSILWKKMLDCFKGADHIKEQGQVYLPAHPSMELDGMSPGEPGFKRYQAYKTRAKYPDYVFDAVVNYTGILHRKPAVFTLPKGLEYMLERASSKGEGLQALLSRINQLQLRDGRCGLLLELPAGQTRGTKPYIAVYEALAIKNWDTGEDELGYESLNFVSLDESRHVMDKTNRSWKWETRERRLVLGSVLKDEPNGTANYKQILLVDDQITTQVDEASNEWVIPQYENKPLTRIPFVFCNSSDLIAEPDRPPLLTLANETISIYQGEGDYRQSLFMQGQDTLVVKGGVTTNDPNPNAPVRVGAGARLDVSQDGDAKYIGVNSQGIPEQRKALEIDHSNAASRSGQLTRTDRASQESGDALRTRVAAKTASLVGIARTGAAALVDVLKICAEWIGEDPSTIDITPNVDFSKSSMLGQDFVQIMTSKGLGAPISMQSIHEWLSDNGMTAIPFESELKLIEKERVQYPYLFPENVKADQNQLQQTTKGDPTQK